MRMINGKNYLSAHEVAKIFGVNRGTIIRWLKQKDKPFRGIEWFCDPMNGFHFFEETHVRALLKNVLSSHK